MKNYKSVGQYLCTIIEQLLSLVKIEIQFCCNSGKFFLLMYIQLQTILSCILGFQEFKMISISNQKLSFRRFLPFFLRYFQRDSMWYFVQAIQPFEFSLFSFSFLVQFYLFFYFSSHTDQLYSLQLYQIVYFRLFNIRRCSISI